MIKYWIKFKFNTITFTVEASGIDKVYFNVHQPRTEDRIEEWDTAIKSLTIPT
jgi:hypothetical protein